MTAILNSFPWMNWSRNSISDRLNPSPAAINFSKLDHFNGLHIRNLQVPDLATRIKPFMQRAGYEVEDDKLIDGYPAHPAKDRHPG